MKGLENLLIMFESDRFHNHLRIRILIHQTKAEQNYKH